MDTTYLIDRIVGFFVVLFSVGTIFHFIRPREIVLHTLNDTIFDEKVFDTEIYLGRIRRMIGKSTVEYDNDSHSLKSKTEERHSFRPPCVGLRYVKAIPKSAYPSLSMSDLEAFFPDIKLGGSWAPPNCTTNHRVAIIIPYRDRYRHLIQLLARLVPMLQQQNIYFRIYVTEQVGRFTFNKGVLMNAAFKEALKEETWSCFVFHDVDLLPENVRNMYTCPWQPRHMSASVDEFGYRLPNTLKDLVGGVFAIQTRHFRQVNGYSNNYWGWGGEDDDMTMRLFKNGYRIDRPPYNIARYEMAKHTKATKNKYRWIIMNKNRRYHKKDGLNSLNYTLVNVVRYPLYTNFLIDVGLPPKLWYFPET